MTTPDPAALEQRLREALAANYMGTLDPLMPMLRRISLASEEADRNLPVFIRALERAGLRLEEGR